MTIGERLVLGALRARDGGWCRYELLDERGRGCAMGLSGIDHFQDNEVARQVAFWIMKALNLQRIPNCFFEPDISTVIFWNDKSDRTSEQVADVLELASLLWEQDQKQQQEVPAVLVGVGV